MKKTLLIAAAALAAGIISTQAQVYSQNIVGYINKPYGANKFTMTANQLVTGTDVAKTNNNIQAVLGTTGWTSDGNGINNTTVYYWDVSLHQWKNAYFYTGTDADNNFGNNLGDGWYTGAGVLANNSLAPGAGFFVKDYSGVAKTNTFVGSVVLGTNVFTLNQGFTTFSAIQPVGTNLSSAPIGLIGVSDPNGINNTGYYHWNGVNNWDIYYYYTGADADNNLGVNLGDGWYTGAGEFLANHPEHWAKVGEGFFISQVSATPLVYTNKFSMP